MVIKKRMSQLLRYVELENLQRAKYLYDLLESRSQMNRCYFTGLGAQPSYKRT